MKKDQYSSVYQRNLALIMVICVMIAGCTCDEGTAKSCRSKVLAKVNGVAICDADVDNVLQNKANRSGVVDAPAVRASALENIIADELARQAGEASAVVKNEKYVEKAEMARAGYEGFLRKELSKLYIREKVEAQVEVSDQEINAYFKENSNNLRKQFHLWKIMYKGNEARIQDARMRLDKGEKFEDVAALEFGGKIPVGTIPWDLPTLHWYQMPKPWTEVLKDMKPGDVSPIIHGEKKRAWILKLISVDEGEADVGQYRSFIAQYLKTYKVRKWVKAVKKELQEKANVIRY